MSYSQKMRERELRLQQEGKRLNDDFYGRYCRENTTIISGPAEGDR